MTMKRIVHDEDQKNASIDLVDVTAVELDALERECRTSVVTFQFMKEDGGRSLSDQATDTIHSVSNKNTRDVYPEMEKPDLKNTTGLTEHIDTQIKHIDSVITALEKGRNQGRVLSLSVEDVHSLVTTLQTRLRLYYTISNVTDEQAREIAKSMGSGDKSQLDGLNKKMRQVDFEWVRLADLPLDERVVKLRKLANERMQPLADILKEINQPVGSSDSHPRFATIGGKEELACCIKNPKDGTYLHADTSKPTFSNKTPETVWKAPQSGLMVMSEKDAVRFAGELKETDLEIVYFKDVQEEMRSENQ